MDAELLGKTALFQGIEPQELEPMLQCLGAVRRAYAKGALIFCAGQVIETLGLVLSGGVNIENDDPWGNKSILGYAGPGQIFAESYACIPGQPLMVSAAAAEPCEILLLNVGRLLQPCGRGCACHTRLIRNLLAMTAQKNLNLSRRILHTAPKTIRGRLLSYLAFEAARQKSATVILPFDRQQLADYLSVDRSALSAELGRMRRDGLLEAQKNRFTLLGPLPDSEL